MAIPGALITGLGSLASTFLGNIGSKSRQKLADRQNVDFWKMQNKYNLPKNQMQRLKDAGLNPNLIYGSSPAGASGSAGSIAPSKAAPYNFQNPVPPSNLLVASQVELNKTQATKNLADSAKSGAEKAKINALLGDQVKQLQIGNDIANIKLEVTGKTKQSQINQIVANANIAELGAVVKQTEADYAKRGLKMDTVGQLMTSLNLSPINSEDQKIIRALIGAWYAGGMLKNILTPALAGKAQKFINK
jgi:uncharacterized protein YbcI